MLPFLIFLISLKIFNCQPSANIFHLGFLHCESEEEAIYVGYRTSASAASIAIDRLKRENLLIGFDFNFTILFDNCNETEAAGKTIELITNHNVDVIIGPTTNQAALPAFVIATYFNVPIISWGLTTAASLVDKNRFPTGGVIAIGSKGLAFALRTVLKKFNWNQFVYLYSLVGNQERCLTLRNDIQEIFSNDQTISIAYTAQLTNFTEDVIQRTLTEISKRGRIVVTCFHHGFSKGYYRQFFIVASKYGFVSNEYVYLFPAFRTKGYMYREENGVQIPGWIGPDGPNENDGLAKIGFERSIFIVDMRGQGKQSENFTVFDREVLSRMKNPPYKCNENMCPTNASSGTYSTQLHDAVYSYGVTMSKILKSDPRNYRNGKVFLNNFPQTFEGMSGPVVINSIGYRNPTLYVLNLNADYNTTIVATIYAEENEATMTDLFSNEAQQFWHFYGGNRPLAKPKCGFTGSDCPPNVFYQNIGWFLAGIGIVIIALIGAISAIIVTYKTKQQEIARQNAQWQIAFNSMQKIEKKTKGDQSMRSLQSGPSTTSTKSGISNDLVETRHYLFFIIPNRNDADRVVARKHMIRPEFDSKTSAFMRQLRSLDHVNLNKFIGLSLDAPQFLSVWRFCSRGSLRDVIRKSTIQMDSFFIYSLMKDIINGLSFLHASNIEFHGMLTSKTCLLNDRWQMKLTDFGIKEYRAHDQFSKFDLLWSAPELLKSENFIGSKEGDVYSFGIISAELITRKSVFDIENRKEDAEELIYMLKKGGMRSPRPELDHDESMEINPALLHLVRDCWTERPSERPTVEEVMSQLRGMNKKRNDNLMDHVFNVLESYASTLEDEVSERMKELVEEKKKSDLLLYRMLPKQVADKLKLGQTIEPETFDLVTLFFSDVVSFTTLAGKCTPLQVVNLLNDLYTTFDGIIDQHDVYKVETIGDGYLCASGLPHRNGDEHTRHIASMSLLFISSLINFRVPHLPNERIKIRIGFHCGSVVAGVVGMTMPRYCLFGDAVNTASRMESNSKPGQIHISSEANAMLQKLGGFQTEKRGEVIIKGKGVMVTYWLLGMNSSAAIKVEKV